MATAPRRRLAFLPLPGPWLFWPVALAVTPEQLEVGAKLVRLRGEFWSKAFEAVAEMADEWSKELRDDGGKN
jgi:hypothetical protein